MRKTATGCLALLVTMGLACRKDPRVQAGDSVLLRYELSVDRKVLESNFDGKPAEAVQGAGILPPGVDAALLGMDPGEEKRLMLLPEQAFGVRDASKVQTLPLSDFGTMAKDLKPGVRVEGFRDGKAETAKVTAIVNGKVTLDFNHPLAGKSVSYRIQVVSTRR